MKVVIFGATGMVGRGVLLEALDSPDVSGVLSVGRRTVDVEHAKLTQLVHDDFTDFGPVAGKLTGYDACFWCLGVSSAGMTEAEYTRVTYEFTLAAAKVLADRNPGMTFCFVSGAGTDSSEAGSVMWARVKGRAENALKTCGFARVVLFRPAFIRPMRGSAPRGALYRSFYAVAWIFYPILRALGGATSTVQVGRAMLAAATGLSTKEILDSRDINELAAASRAAS